MDYKHIAAGYNELHKEEQLNKLKIIANHINPKGLLLDIGAGTGISTEFFKEKAECISLDPCYEMLSQSSCHKVCSKAEKLPFRKNTFDVIISVTSLHHADLKKAFKEIKRVAKPNSQIALTFFKKSKNIPSKLRGFKRIDEEKDAIFIRA